jgi:hypothetical protein
MADQVKFPAAPEDLSAKEQKKRKAAISQGRRIVALSDELADMLDAYVAKAKAELVAMYKTAGELRKLQRGIYGDIDAPERQGLWEEFGFNPDWKITKRGLRSNREYVVDMVSQVDDDDEWEDV